MVDILWEWRKVCWFKFILDGPPCFFKKMAKLVVMGTICNPWIGLPGLDCKDCIILGLGLHNPWKSIQLLLFSRLRNPNPWIGICAIQWNLSNKLLFLDWDFQSLDCNPPINCTGLVGLVKRHFSPSQTIFFKIFEDVSSFWPTFWPTLRSSQVFLRKIFIYASVIFLHVV